MIYFARRKDGLGPIKIGCSAFPKKRLYQLGIDYQTTFELLACAPGDFLTERNLHLKFAAHLVAMQSSRPGRKSAIPGHKEWFAANEEVLAFVAAVSETGSISLSKDECRERVFAERYLAGETLQEIGDAYGLTRERVRQVLRRIGVKSLGLREQHKLKPHELTVAEIAAAFAYRDGRELPKDICARFGLGREQLLTACRRLRIKTKPRGAPLRVDAKEVEAKVASLYRQGASLDHIRSEFGWSHITYVYRWLQRAGVKPTRRPRRDLRAAA
jgi:transposase